MVDPLAVNVGSFCLTTTLCFNEDDWRRLLSSSTIPTVSAENEDWPSSLMTYSKSLTTSEMLTVVP